MENSDAFIFCDAEDGPDTHHPETDKEARARIERDAARLAEHEAWGLAECERMKAKLGA